MSKYRKLRRLFLLLAIFLTSAGLAFAGDYLLGDVNGDGEVNVADVAAVINHIGGETIEGFKAIAANVNSDEEINVADVAGIINIIQSKTIGGSGSTASTLIFAETEVAKSYGDASFSVDIYRAGSTGAITYASDNTDAVTVNAATGEMTIVGGGTAVITATLAADDDCEQATATVTVTVGKSNITDLAAALTTTPAAKLDGENNQTATGEALDLITAGATDAGTLKYKMTTTNEQPSKEADGWSTNIPTATEAGTYYVWYYIEGNDNYNDSDVCETPITVTIEEGTTASVPAGAINGKFTINADGGQVYFSQGNLQAIWDGSIWSWTFAANQWDYIGNAAANISISGNGSVSAAGSVDLFGWVGASSTWTGAAQYGISDSKTSDSTDGYGNVDTEALKSDWGNTMDTGWSTQTGASITGWRMLTLAEWQYLFDTRTTGGTVFGTSQARYAHATINTDGTSVNGMILFPDGVNIASSEVTTIGTVNATSEWATKCTSAQWTALAAKGCVFLPAAGLRNGTSILNVDANGYYRASSPAKAVKYAYHMGFSSGKLNTSASTNRHAGLSVRLIHFVGPESAIITMNTEELTINIGETQTRTAHTTRGTVTYTSGNKSIATVDENGTVTGIAEGTTTITASVAEGDSWNAATPVSYNVTVQQGDPYNSIALGDIVYGDGTFSSTLDLKNGTRSPVGIVVYVGNDKVTCTGRTVGTGTNQRTVGGHALVMGLKHIETSSKWGATYIQQTSKGRITSNGASLYRTTYDIADGYWVTTQTLAQYTSTSDQETYFKANYQAYHYAGLSAPYASTGWFLPSTSQWYYACQYLFGKYPGVSGSYVSCTNAIQTLNSKLSKAGVGNYTEHPTNSDLHLWTSNDYSQGSAWQFIISVSYGLKISDYSKDWGGTSSSYTYLRPFFAL